ncbi:MAG TPA: HAD-IIIA family hydrolase [Burkholderiaceae bacterium]|nr:HAD-IIIA family hydrolase [Burkholderiaceae bacterium]
MQTEQRAAAIRFVILDVDGVLTDGRLYYGPEGEALKVFDVRDGHGIKLLMRSGIDVALLTARSSPMVTARARELGISRVLQGQHDKAAGFAQLLADTGLQASVCAYMGDDLPDLPVLRQVGLAATVADACEAVRQCAHWISQAPGGRGAVRELAHMILQAQGQWTSHA